MFGFCVRAASTEWAPSDAALTQNPNMHLLEAYLALEAASNDPLWRIRADGLVAMFEGYLYDAKTGVVGEFYDAAGRPHPETGHLVEPGHHFEWCWLLHTYADRRGTAPLPAADRLFDWAVAHGIDAKHGGIFDELDRCGQVLSATKRIWPVGECIKAHAIRWRSRNDPSARAGMVAWVDFLIENYLRSGGLWHETLNQDRTPHLSEMPGTTPYHLLTAAADALPILDSNR
jgi:mannose/cellobiose epimerase-like protein (N-acyl-D-glucosamine 2-epimerase family)